MTMCEPFVADAPSVLDTIDLLSAVRGMRRRFDVPSLFNGIISLPSIPVVTPTIATPKKTRAPRTSQSFEPAERKIDAELIEVVAIPAVAQRAPMRDVVFEPYVSQRLQIPGAHEHPTPLVESAAMASVVPPAPTYRPMLPKRLIEGGLLSIAQLEAIVYAGQAHSQYLEEQLVKLAKPEIPTETHTEVVEISRIRRIRHHLSNGSFVDTEYNEPTFRGHSFIAFRDTASMHRNEVHCWAHSLEQAIGSLAVRENSVAFRKGYYCGDNTGVGKGRTICGVIIDSFARGCRKAIWISKTPKLSGDAIRDWVDLGGNKDEIIPLAKIGASDAILATRGILFLTYGLLKSAAQDNSGVKGKTRLQQVIDWAGTDFDGVLALDEAHQMKSAISVRKSRGHSDVSLAATAGCDLQRILPDARVMYASATGATEVANLAYCDRLGLWGRGTPFPTKESFVTQIESGGVASMELIARDLKSRGLLIARGLSFDGVEYERLIHELSPEQRQIYDGLCEAWQVVLENINHALELVATNGNGNVDAKAKGAAYSRFWGFHQRFFSVVLIAMKMPSVLTDIEEQLAAGNCCVLQLVNTQEAVMERQLAKLDENDDLSDIDMTPRDMLAQLIGHCFPTQQMEAYTDGSTGKARVRPVTDSNGNPVLNREAVAMRDRLLDGVGALTCPDGPLEMLVNHFGDTQIAEITGRKRRVVRKMVDGIEKTVIEKRSPMKCMAEAADFQDGKRRILIFSDAGGTGMSYHASIKAKNQTRRIHYLIQAGWVADQALQGFGRVHRSAQRCSPLFKLASTSLKGERRFLSTIARRLDQLGALTKGQRQASGAGSGKGKGIFSAADNLEGDLARAALYQLFRDLYAGEVEGISLEQFEKWTGLKLTEEDD